MAVKTYQQGETVVIDGDSTNRAGAATSPDTSMTITITDPAATDQVTAAAMTSDGTGDFHYDYNLAAAAVLGVWTYEIVSTNAGNVTIEPGRFNVVRRST